MMFINVVVNYVNYNINNTDNNLNYVSNKLQLRLENSIGIIR